MFPVMLTAAKFPDVAFAVVFTLLCLCANESFECLDEYVGWHECLYMSSAFWNNKAMHISAHAPASVALLARACRRVCVRVHACVAPTLPSPLSAPAFLTVMFSFGSNEF